jgi:hypothetical protein
MKIDEPGNGKVQRVAATLIYDSLMDSKSSGVRGAGLVSRQCLYRAAEYDIHLWFGSTEGTEFQTVAGQILPHDSDLKEVTGVAVTLKDVYDQTFTKQTNPFGEFVFDQIRSGCYDLELQLQKWMIAVSNLFVTPLNQV